MLLIVKLDMVENFLWAEAIQAAPFGRKVIQLCCGLHYHIANDGSWEHLVRNPMISGANMLLEDMIIALGFRNMFLSVCKIGHEGPSTVLEDKENWFEFVICAHFCDLEGGLVVQL